jgi:hypothetical protein
MMNTDSYWKCVEMARFQFSKQCRAMRRGGVPHHSLHVPYYHKVNQQFHGQSYDEVCTSPMALGDNRDQLQVKAGASALTPSGQLLTAATRDHTFHTLLLAVWTACDVRIVKTVCSHEAHGRSFRKRTEEQSSFRGLHLLYPNLCSSWFSPALACPKRRLARHADCRSPSPGIHLCLLLAWQVYIYNSSHPHDPHVTTGFEVGNPDPRPYEY